MEADGFFSRDRHSVKWGRAFRERHNYIIFVLNTAIVGMFTHVHIYLNFQNHLGVFILLSDIQRLMSQVGGVASGSVAEAILFVRLEDSGQKGLCHPYHAVLEQEEHPCASGSTLLF